MSNRERDPAIRLLNFSSALPRQDCALCGSESGDALVCAHCLVTLPRIENACARCAIALPAGATLCGACMRRNTWDIDDALAIFEYRFPVDRLVQRFKYAGDLALGHWLADRLADIAVGRARPDLVVATPLSTRGLKRRGFNQALVIARHVAKRLRLPCEIAAVRKVRDTPAQEGLDRRERVANLRDAFTCSVRIDGKHVALVDDVITTGATAGAIARVLHETGAARVSAWAVARTPDPALR